MRGLGEITVGGAAILKNIQEDDIDEFDVKNVSSTRIRNVARAYGWWIAKDCCTVAILKVCRANHARGIDTQGMN